LALASHREAIRLNPNLADAHNGVGNVLRDKRNLNAAIDAYKEAIRLDPKQAFVHSNLGHALRDQRDAVGAIACFREAIRLDPTYAFGHNGLGIVLKDIGTSRAPSLASGMPSASTQDLPPPTPISDWP
jgi:tetratricopeptide (TPR) repeat protein